MFGWNLALRRRVFLDCSEPVNWAMTPRANWKVYLKLLMVSCAASLFPAAATRDSGRLDIINRQTGNQVRSNCAAKRAS
jgi:non-homologous end joining protein Ku